MPIFPLFTFGQNKTRNIADYAEKKETSLTIKKNIITQSQNNRIFFPKGLIQAFDQKMSNFSLFRFGQNKTRNNA